MIEGRVRASEYDFVKQCTHLPYILFMDNLCIFGLHYHVENRTHCFWKKKTCSEEGKYQLLQTQPELFHICLCSAHRPVFLAHQPKRRHTNFQTECKQIRELLFSALSGARASLRTGSSAHGQAHQVTGTGFFKTYFSFIFYKWLHLKNVQI
jgi:hypothetical protein